MESLSFGCLKLGLAASFESVVLCLDGAFGARCSTIHGHHQPHRNPGLDCSLASTTLCGILVWNLVRNSGTTIDGRALRGAYALEHVCLSGNWISGSAFVG